MSREIHEMDKRCVNRHNELAKNFNVISNQQARMVNNENIKLAKEMFTHSYEKGSSYSNLIIIAGYIGFFTLWGSLRKELPSWAILVSGFCILLSLLIFICFELYKMIELSIKMNRISKRLQNSFENTIAEVKIIEENSALRSSRVWIYTLIPTVFFGLSAGFVLLYCFVSEFLVLILSK
ncbi:hypothetical protein [Marinomonas aquiplantarum]|uniref:Uncharacterized protein n=1 Tax=Marinomonas aquiplantarum TaxID=491951 RepID=A0A366CYA8_9GAMM|nr:hypothetical protein [Marinomonas aquiplantarum]RBO82646.1 hypothetical protein DFP76_105111 [Marinomonas aquiplantarum]